MKKMSTTEILAALLGMVQDCYDNEALSVTQLENCYLSLGYYWDDECAGWLPSAPTTAPEEMAAPDPDLKKIVEDLTAENARLHTINAIVMRGLERIALKKVVLGSYEYIAKTALDDARAVQ